MRASRISVLATLALVGGLLGAPPASAADPAATVGLFPVGSNTESPVNVDPITRTADGVVWRQPGDPNLWISGTWGARYTRLGGAPETAGNLLSRYDSAAHAFVYETISSDRTDHTVAVPANLTFLASTSTGYLAQLGTGPYELVSVDVLTGTDPVVFGTTTVSQSTLKTSSAGALAQSGVAGQYVYFPFAAPGSGQVLQTPANSTCTLTSTRLYCAWSDGTTNHLSRLPLTGGTGDQIDVTAASVVEVPTGIAFASGNGTITSLATWALTDPAPTTVLAGTFGMTSTIAAAADDPSVVLVSHPGAYFDAGIYAVSLAEGNPTLVRATTAVQKRQATDVAIAPGKLVWADNLSYPGEIEGVDLTGSTPGPIRGAAYGTGGTLSVSAGRLTYSVFSSGPTPGPSKVDDGLAPQQLNDSGVVSQLSGDRLLVQSRVAGSGSAALPWTLKDLRSGRTTALPGAVSYHLWGERLARLDADGSVWVLDLRTGAAPVQVRAASAGLTGGTVQIAGDTVAWQVNSAAGGASTTEVKTRNLATMAPAAALPGLSTLSGLSTGYAVGSACTTSDSCRTAAVSLADGSATTFDPPPSTGRHDVAVDGNTVAFVAASGIPSLFALPAYPDQPRLLGSPARTSTVSAPQPWTARVIASRVLGSCQIEIRDAAHTLVRALSCLDPHAAATVTWDGKNTAGALVPDGSYTWRLVGAAGGVALADYDGSTSGLSGALTMIPAVSALSPAANSTVVSQTANVTATFSVPVTGISGTTFVLKTPAGTTIPAVVSYNSTTRTATLNPTATLGADVRYTATLIGGATAIRDAGNRPLTTRSWSFVTGPAPKPIATTPLDGTGPAVSTTITATFSEAVQGVSATTFTLEDAHGRTVPAVVTYAATTRVATLNPTGDLSPDTLYYASLDGGAGGIHDAAGNPLAYFTWILHTGPPPTVTARTPGVNATGTQINGNITATFSEPVQGVSTYSVTLTSLAGTKVPALVTYHATNRTVTLNPIATLGRDVRYRVTLLGAPGGITDLAGNYLTTSWWIFTTGTR